MNGVIRSFIPCTYLPPNRRIQNAGSDVVSAVQKRTVAGDWCLVASYIDISMGSLLPCWKSVCVALAGMRSCRRGCEINAGRHPLMGRSLVHRAAAAEHSPCAWMPNSPHKKDSVEGKLHSVVFEQIHARICPRQIHSNLWGGKQSIFLVMVHKPRGLDSGLGYSLISEVAAEEFRV